MSLSQSRRVWDTAPSDTSAAHMLIMLALADFAQDEGGCFPSIAALAKKCRMSERQIRRHLRMMEKNKLISTIQRGGKGNANQYFLNDPMCPVLPFTEPDLKPDTLGTESRTPEVVTLSPEVIKADTACPLNSKERSKQRSGTKSKERRDPVVSLFHLPDWISTSDWEAFEELRRVVRRPMTDRAREQIVKKLASFRDRGMTPEAVLNQSIVNSWQDVYELREDTNAKHKGNGAKTSGGAYRGGSGQYANLRTNGVAS